MGSEDNKAIVRRFLEEVINKGNLALVDELVAADLVDHAAPPGMEGNRDGLKAFFTTFRGAFPDLHYTVDDVIAEGDRVVQRTTAHGTMKGDFAGMPASGKSASWSEVHITRLSNGKLAEHWAVIDQLGMLQQLGFAQVPGQPAGVAG